MKKFIISTEILSKVLHKLSYAVAAKSTLPALSSIYCKVSDKAIEFIASDLEITIHYRCECETSGEGFEFLLPYQLISKIVALNKRMPLSFSMEKKGIKIQGDGDSYELKSLEKIDSFPKLQEVPKKNSIDITEKFIDLLSTASETVGKEDKRPALAKVLLELRKEKTTIASTDGGYVVFSYSFDALLSAEEDDILISPKIIKALDKGEETKLYWNKKVFAFDSKDITIVVTRPDIKFVNFRAIFPADHPTNLTVNRYHLITALEKCNINSDPFKSSFLRLKKTDGKVMLEANDQDYGININVSVDGQYSGEVSEVKFNSEKMLRIMNQVEFENIDLAIHAKDRAILFRSTEDAGYIGLQMPNS